MGRRKFGPLEVPEYYLIRHDMPPEKCDRINSAKVCPDTSHYGPNWYKFAYCQKGSPHGLIDPSDPEWCDTVAEVWLYRKDEAYIKWFGASPPKRGWGGKLYRELEDYLRDKRCVKRLTLHDDSFGFWEHEGFKALTEQRPGDDTWVRFYSNYPPREKELKVPESCFKKRK